MKMYYALVCHNYQHRLCWTLSSIAQQSIFPANVTVDIACLPNNGNPSNEAIATYFNNIGLGVRLTYIHDKDIFAKRGLVRNIQIENAIKCDSDYIWFADADHVYHPDMFGRLTSWLVQHGKNYHACIFSRAKRHTEVDKTNKLVLESVAEMPYIDNVFARALGIPTIEHIDKSRLAPGNMQVVALQDIIDLNNGLYVDPKHCRDKHMFKKGQKALSDMTFRSLIGRSRAIRLPLQIHLNHVRDKELNTHTEVQR